MNPTNPVLQHLAMCESIILKRMLNPQDPTNQERLGEIDPSYYDDDEEIPLGI
jgi:hypothetical protein